MSVGVSSDDKIRVLDIVRGTTVDGPGFRTSIYVAGCSHHCKGCHNPQSWDFNAGKEMGFDEIMAIVEDEDWDVTISGGDPLYQPEKIKELAGRIHATGHTVWLYTGFIWEDLIKIPSILNVLSEIDVIVDGPFLESERNTDLLFRGSGNQRIIDVAASLLTGKTVEWHR